MDDDFDDRDFDYFHDDDDLSKEDYEERIPLIQEMKKHLKKVKDIYKKAGLQYYKYVDEVLNECDYVEALYKRDYSNWTLADHQYVDRVEEKVRNILEDFKVYSMLISLKTKNKNNNQNTYGIKIKF